jgi:RHS repeat-associated protein
LLNVDAHATVLREISGDLVYTAYGLRARADLVTELGFNGQIIERYTRTYLLGNGLRAYSPALMRFYSPDTLSPFGKGGLNAYAYCHGDPVNNVDPSGQFRLFGGLLKPKLPRAVKSFLREADAYNSRQTSLQPTLGEVPQHKLDRARAVLERKKDKQFGKLGAHDQRVMTDNLDPRRTFNAADHVNSPNTQRFRSALTNLVVFDAAVSGGGPPPRTAQVLHLRAFNYELPLPSYDSLVDRSGLPSYQYVEISMREVRRQ